MQILVFCGVLVALQSLGRFLKGAGELHSGFEKVLGATDQQDRWPK